MITELRKIEEQISDKIAQSLDRKEKVENESFSRQGVKELIALDRKIKNLQLAYGAVKNAISHL